MTFIMDLATVSFVAKHFSWTTGVSTYIEQPGIRVQGARI